MTGRANLTPARRQYLGIADDAPICSRCGEINDRPPQRYCSGCHAGYMKAWRSTRISVSREALIPRDDELEAVARAAADLDDPDAVALLAGRAT